MNVGGTVVTGTGIRGPSRCVGPEASAILF